MSFYLEGLLSVMFVYSIVYGLINFGYGAGRDSVVHKVERTVSEMDTREWQNLNKAKTLLDEIRGSK